MPAWGNMREVEYMNQIINEMGLQNAQISNIRSKRGIHIYSVNADGDKYILKVFDNEDDRREIHNYKLLNSLEIPTLPVLKYTETALLLPDVNADNTYRLGIENDLNDKQTARLIARWYKCLHAKGYSCDLNDLYSETDVITVENIKATAEKTNTQDNALWKALYDNLDIIKTKIKSMPHTLTYNDFYWTNLVVARDGQSAMMFDYNLLGKGYAYADVRNVTSSLTDGAKQAFLDEYGSIRDEEVIADDILSPLYIILCPEWGGAAHEELKIHNDGVHGERLITKLYKWLEL
jgi:hypothetical protein